MDQECSTEAVAFLRLEEELRGGTPGSGNSLGCVSSSEPQKLSSEKLRESAWPSEVYTRARQVGGSL